MFKRTLFFASLLALLVMLGLVMFLGRGVQAGGPTQDGATPTPLPEIDYAPLPASGPLTEPGDYEAFITVADFERRFLLHIPPGYDPSTPTPLVISFHGYTGTPEGHARYTGLVPKSDAAGYILVMPEGQGDPPAWYTHEGAEDFYEDDSLFTRQIIDTLQARLNIDQRRIYATGMSNGGGMAGRVACNLSDIVAAIAPISANHFYNDGCTPLRPVPVLAVHGRADEIAPYEGKSTLLANIPFYMEQWVARNSCNEDAEVSEWEPGGNSVIEQVTIEHWSGCADDADVYLYTYEEMGHAYPATTAPDLIWDFFLEHPLPEEYLDNPPTEPIVIELDESQEASGIQVAPGSYVADVIVLGQRREYFLHVPEAYDPATSIPLVISFHDFASDPPSNARRTGLLAKAEEEGFVVVFPGGSGDPLGWYTLSDPPPALPDDVEYTRRLLDQLQAQMNIDTARIFVTGYSNGGGMAHRVACELPDRITAIGVVAAGHFNDDPCGPDQPVPVYAIHGRIDGIIPYAGNETTMPIPDWALQWTQRNQCDEVPVEEPSNDSETTIITWDDCANNATVTLMTIDDLGHDYPDGATDRLWDFFASFPRTDEDENEETDEPIAYEPGDYSGSVFSWGTLRHYNFHLPPQYDGETELPLLISIHGFTGTPASNARSTQFAQKADEEGFIVVFPEGRDAGNGQLGWYSRDIAPPNFPDDNRFLRAMVEQLEREIVFDSNRIYATGMSNGGGMAHRLGCDMSDIIAAVAPVAGAHSIEDTCEPGRPVPVIALHGREDAIVGYDGIEDIAAPIPDWALDWAERNGCDLEPTVTTPEEGITVETWANCEAGVEVVLVSYDDAGHRWMPDATDRVWDFLSQYTLDAGSAPVSP